MRRKGADLLYRTSHACVAHPTRKGCLLITCGYSEKTGYFNDVVVLDTERCAIEPFMQALNASSSLTTYGIS